MSLFAAALWQRECRIIADTAAFLEGGAFHAHTTKLLVLPHAGIVLGGRGAFEVLLTWHSDLMCYPPAGGIDGMRTSGLELLQAAFDAYEARWLKAGHPMTRDGTIEGSNAGAMVEFIAVGYSRSARVYRAVVLSNVTDRFEAQIFDGCRDGSLLMAPLIEDFGREAKVLSPRDLLRASLVQFRTVDHVERRRGKHSAGCGGAMLGAHLTADGHSRFALIGEYPNLKELGYVGLAGMPQERPAKPQAARDAALAGGETRQERRARERAAKKRARKLG